jgi:hypothetical protein
LGAFFQSPLYIFLFITFVYTYKNNPPFPQKSQKALKALTFSWGIFSKMPRKKPPKSPHRAKKYPARLIEPYGAGLVFISTNILLQGLYLHSQTSLDKGTQRKTTENELPSLTQCTA